MARQLRARHSHRAWVSRGKLHVWGGCVEEQSSKFNMERHGEEVKQLTKVVKVFDMKGKREWTSVTTTGDDRPLGIRDAALALLGEDDTRAIVFGGYCGHGAACFHNSLHELDTKSWEWYVLIPDTKDLDDLAPMLKRNSGAVGFTRKGKKYVCVFAGIGLQGSSQLQKHSEYATELTERMSECTTNELHCAEITGHKAEWFWPDITGSAPPPCTDFSFIKTSDLEVVTMGGFVKAASLHDGVYHLNLEHWEWSKIFSSPDVKRTRHFSTLLAPGKILTMGGAGENQATRKDMCIIDVKTGNTEMVLSEPKICQRQWHSITAIPLNGSGTSVSVVAIGGVTARDKQLDPTLWPKAETDFMMEFDLMEAQDGTKKWKLTHILELSRNIVEQVVDEGIQKDIQEVNTDKKQLHVAEQVKVLQDKPKTSEERVQPLQDKLRGSEAEFTSLKKKSSTKEFEIENLMQEDLTLRKESSENQSVNLLVEDLKVKLASLMKISSANEVEIGSLTKEVLALIEKIIPLQSSIHASVQASCLEISIGSLRNAKVYADTVMDVCGDHYQSIEWKGYGFSLTIPEGSVPPGKTIRLAVKLISLDSFVLPKDHHLVSSFFWVSASQVFKEEVSLHISHCAYIHSDEEAACFKFVAAKCSQKSLPYLFKSREGEFKPESSLGTIKIKHFSMIAVTYKGPERDLHRKYAAHCYCQQCSSLTWQFEISILPKLPDFETLLKEKYQCNGWILHHEQNVIFEQPPNPGEKKKEKSISLQLELPEDSSCSKWDVFFTYEFKVLKSDVDTMSPGCLFSPCNMVIRWKGKPGEDDLMALKQRVNLVGAEKPSNYFILCVDPHKWQRESSIQSHLQTHGMNFCVAKSRVLRRLCNDLRVVIEGDLENIRFELSAVDLIPLEVRDQRNAGVMVSTIEKKLLTDESVWDKLVEVLNSCNSQALAKKLSDQLMKELHKQ